MRLTALTAFVVLAGCGSLRQEAPEPTPDEVRKLIVRLLPSQASDRQGWATDIYAAFAAQSLKPSKENLCSVVAVTEQESTFQADPKVPGLPRIARQEIDRRAAKMHVPDLLVRGALQLRSPDGKTYNQRLDSVRSEKELSKMFDDFIGMAPLGQTLFGSLNPVQTGGPMQVSIAFAEKHAQGYPYPVQGTIRQEVFTRRGGLYFGILHLLGYAAPYDKSIYRFADFNVGWYASRNAAFQNAVSRASGIALELDGDLILHGSALPGATELAVRTLGKRMDMSNWTIRRQLEEGDLADFADTTLYERVFALADKAERKPLPRQMLPVIKLESPKITRRLTTAWFAKRVDDRRVRCLARAR
nr:DUF1615 domain-containing protein [Pseudomonas sp. R5(2019)]